MPDTNNKKIPWHTITWFVGIIFFSGIAFALVKFTSKEVEEIKPKVEQNERDIADNEKNIAVVQEAQIWTKEALIEIKDGIKDIKEKL
jgi:hypothetical protein